MKLITFLRLCKQIERPIALDGIKKKINNGAYKTLGSFEDDFELMFENAKQYNAEGSDVYLDAEDLQVIGLSTILRFTTLGMDDPLFIWFACLPTNTLFSLS